MRLVLNGLKSVLHRFGLDEACLTRLECHFHQLLGYIDCIIALKPLLIWKHEPLKCHGIDATGRLDFDNTAIVVFITIRTTPVEKVHLEGMGLIGLVFGTPSAHLAPPWRLSDDLT
jgi:uncharacterized Tic20 family protein